jgi:hypothetical protein
MRSRALLFACTTIFFSAAVAGAQTVAYVNAGPEIHAVQADHTSTIVHTTSTDVGGLAYSSEGDCTPSPPNDEDDCTLFFSEPALHRIGKFVPSGTVVNGVNSTLEWVFQGSTETPRQIRFLANGHLLATTGESGLCEIDLSSGQVATSCTPPTAPPSCVVPSGSFAGSGLAITAAGDCLYTNTRSAPATTDDTVEGAVSFGVTAPVGLAAASVSGGVNVGMIDSRQGTLDAKDILVSSGNALLRFDHDGTALGAYATLPAGNQAALVHVRLDGSVYVASATNDTDDPNGKLWFIDSNTPKVGGVFQPIAPFWTAPRQSGPVKYLPSFAVAAPPGSRQVDDTAELTAHSYTFGSHTVQTVAQLACPVTVIASQVSRGEANGMLDDLSSNYGTVDYKGAEGWPIVYSIPSMDENHDQIDDCGDFFITSIGAFLDGPLNTPWGVIRCPASEPCQVVTTAVQPFVDPSGDPTNTGTGRGRSIWSTVEALQENQQPGVFPLEVCGPSTPLNAAPAVTSNQQIAQYVTACTDNLPQTACLVPAFKLGSNLSFKVEFKSDCENPQAQSVRVDTPTYPDSGAILSVMKVLSAGNVGFTILNSSGSSVPSPPVFRVNGPRGLIFTLSTVPNAATPWTGGNSPGTFYVATISPVGVGIPVPGTDGQLFGTKSVLFRLTGQ